VETVSRTDGRTWVSLNASFAYGGERKKKIKKKQKNKTKTFFPLGNKTINVNHSRPTGFPSLINIILKFENIWSMHTKAIAWKP
jgi:hypothetical protein